MEESTLTIPGKSGYSGSARIRDLVIDLERRVYVRSVDLPSVSPLYKVNYSTLFPRLPG